MPQNRFRSLNTALQERFGEKIYRLSLNGGCTCPNRDGTWEPEAASSAAPVVPGILPPALPFR